MRRRSARSEAPCACSSRAQACVTCVPRPRRHVLVVFGGRAGYPGDDINKLPWMAKVARQAFPGESPGEAPFLHRGVAVRVGPGAPEPMRRSLVYRLSYNRFHLAGTEGALRGLSQCSLRRTSQGSLGRRARRCLVSPRAAGTCRMRRSDVDDAEEIALTHFDEAFTSRNWLARKSCMRQIPTHSLLQLAETVCDGRADEVIALISCPYHGRFASTQFCLSRVPGCRCSKSAVAADKRRG